MLHDDLRTLLALAGCDRDTPLAASPLQAVIDAVNVMATSGDERGWRLAIPEGTPYGAARRRGRMLPFVQLASAVAVCDLVPVASDLLQDTTAYVDKHPDAYGEHRVYVRDETALPGLPWFGFRRLGDAIGWMAAVSSDPEVLDVPDWEPDEWEQGPTSAEWVLDQMLEEDLPGLWDGTCPIGGDPDPIDLADRSPGWQRRLCLGSLRHVGATGRVPDLGAAQGLLGAEALAFLEHLAELERAIDARG